LALPIHSYRASVTEIADNPNPQQSHPLCQFGHNPRYFW
jgi:hypothetical protein